MNTIRLLIVLAAGLCTSSAEKSIISTLEQTVNCEVYVPNAFSPNNDGVNDDFRPLPGSDCTITDYEINIYDRNGSLVFQSTDANQGWDGAYRGEPAAAAVYYYVFQYTITSESGEDKEIMTGDFSLIR